MSMTHMIILGIIALIVIPPEKLPEVARQVARFISELKNSADQIMGELKQEAIFKPNDIIDKNIKEKLAELHRDINQTIDLDKPLQKPQPLAQTTEPAQAIEPAQPVQATTATENSENSAQISSTTNETNQNSNTDTKKS